MICVKFHSNPVGDVFAACDEELIGKVLEEDGRKILISEGFYKGETISEDEFRERMKEMPTMNLMGERTIAIACEEGYVDEDNILIIAGVKHAQVVR